MFQVSADDDGTCTKHWLLDLKTPESASIRQVAPSAAASADNRPNVTLVCSDKTLSALSRGSLSPEFAYVRGQLKIKGQMGVAMKVKALLELAAGLLK